MVVIMRDYILAIRAIAWMEDHPVQKDAILVYGPLSSGEEPTVFYIKRNKNSLTVRLVIK